MSVGSATARSSSSTICPRSCQAVRIFPSACARGSEAPPGAPRTSEVTEAEQTLARLYTEGTLLLDELISQEIELAQVNEALEVMGSGEIARSVIKY